MKKLVSVLLAVVMLLSVAAFAEGEYRVAMVTDYGDITDQSFNQTTYEACKAFCDANGIDFTYYKPTGDSTAERVAMIEKADDEGYNIIVLPGYAFGEPIAEVQEEYPDLMIIALEVSEADLGGVELGPNVFSQLYIGQLSGFMAGYAAVKLGYDHLGFLGGMAVPGVMQYGYGYIQGVDAAAAETGRDVTLEYVYGNQFYGDADITAYMDTWYQNMGVQVVFACGGGIYTSAAEAAAKVGGKVIGVDVDQKNQIDGTYGEGITLTSAMKGLSVTINHLLSEAIAGNFANYGGKVESVGLVGTDPAENYMQLAPSTQWNDGFTEADYAELVAKIYNGEITISEDITALPAVTAITFNDLGTVK